MAEQAEKRGCADCLFFDEDSKHSTEGLGYCRGLPPRAELMRRDAPASVEDHYAVWPVVHVSDWCGAWMERRDVES